MRNGDLSEYLARGSGYQIYNPFTTTLHGGRCVRQPFAGNIIPHVSDSPPPLHRTNPATSKC
jgi:hypothetical protein